MPCAEIYLFGCASVVDQTGRSGTGCKFAVDAAELESCAKLKPLRRRSIETERSMEPPGTAEEFSRKRATYPQIIPPDVRFQVWNLPLPPGSIVQKRRLRMCRRLSSKQARFSSTDIWKTAQGRERTYSSIEPMM